MLDLLETHLASKLAGTQTCASDVSGRQLARPAAWPQHVAHPPQRRPEQRTW